MLHTMSTDSIFQFFFCMLKFSCHSHLRSIFMGLGIFKETYLRILPCFSFFDVGDEQVQEV